MRRKKIPEPGQFRKNNIHGGQLWASRKECKLTDKMAGQIIERVYTSKKVGIHQLRQVRHSFSYAYYLTTGKARELPRSQGSVAVLQDVHPPWRPQTTESNSDARCSKSQDSVEEAVESKL